ncbi:MAG TPA: glycosyltransferase [Solirubrobacteraceae bacterium]|nr:glycosyltransferase [Solirubrobacteraceae bacterium]
MFTVLHVGVAETLRRNAFGQMAGVERYGFRSAAACDAASPFAEELRAAGVEVAEIGIGARPAAQEMGSATRLLARRLREGDVDLVHTHNAHHGLVGRLLARLRGIPSVHTWRYSPVDAATGAASTLAYGGLEAVASRAGSAVLFQNREDLAFAVRTRIVPPTRVRFVGNGIRLDRYRGIAVDRDAVLRSIGIDPATRVVLCVARLDDRKRPGDVIRAVAATRREDVSLLLVGRGPDEDDLRALAGSEGLDGRVVFAGHRQDVPELMAASDVFCLASRREGIPRAAMEAMAGGLPVVATDVVGTRELVTDGRTGLLAPFGDVGALSRNLLRVLDDRELARSLSAAGSAHVEAEHDEDEVIRRVADVYASVLLAAGRTPA